MNHLPALHVGSPTLAGPLTVFPVWTDAPAAARSYLPLSASVAAVREKSTGPSVGHLTIGNPAAEAILLLEGALLTGGWQHRVLAEDVLIAAGESRDVRVACVEQGRWRGQVEQELGHTCAPLAVRGALRGIRRPDAGDGRRSSARPGSDPTAVQSDVWTRVTGYERRFGASATSSLVDVHRRVAPGLDAVLAGIRPLVGQRGVLVGISGHPVLLEVFDHPDTLAEQLRPILTAAGIDAVGARFLPTPGHRARTFARRVEGMRLDDPAHEPGRPAVLDGRDDLAATRALMAAGHVVHASALNVRHSLVLAA